MIVDTREWWVGEKRRMADKECCCCFFVSFFGLKSELKNASGGLNKNEAIELAK
jgi:hypothetical protein